MSRLFNPSRLKLARLRRGISIKGLGDKIERTSRTISNYENGHEIPPENIIESIAKILNFPFEFFFEDDIEEFDTEAVSFRALSKMTATQKNVAISAGQIAVLLNNWIEKKLNIPLPQLPDYKDLSPSAAAHALRQEWGLGELSINNMIHLLESKGIRVFSLLYNAKEIDAFSFWKNGVPYIFLNHQKSGERSRFDAAHELGHLILHKHAKPQGREAESQADSFASCFLMPEDSVRSKAVFMPNLEIMLRLKKHWKVSVAALVRRFKDLDLITDWYYQKLNIQMSQNGMLTKEPDGIEHERSLLFEKVFKLLWSQGITREKIAHELVLPLTDLDNLVFGLSAPNEPVITSKPNLQLIR